MKKLILLLTFCFTILNFVQAQIPPNAFNYSAVARGTQGQPIASQNIGIRFSILKTSVNGLAQYVETHQTTTDPFGLFNLKIGGGSVQSGNFASIDWGADNYFLKVELDAQGNINYFHMGTTQFVSVPYALYSGNSSYAQNGIDSVSTNGDTLYLSNGDIFINPSYFSGDYNDLSNQPTTINSISTNGDTLYLSNGQTFISSNISSISQHYIGEQFGGGVIFHLWKDSQGIEHGLIVDLVDLDTAMVWSNVEQVLIGTSAQSKWNGLSNSNAIVSQVGHINSAASLCLNSNNNGFSDWYLPSIDELNLISQNRFNINLSLSQINSASMLVDEKYWSSTEIGFDDARAFDFKQGQIYDSSTEYLGGIKWVAFNVRAIRAF